MKLTDKEYWESGYNSMLGSINHSNKVDVDGRVKRFFKKIFGTKIIEFFQPYDDYLISNIIDNYINNQNKHFNVIEIGCAPAKYLVRFAKKYNLVPYGVEYTDAGYQLSKESFVEHGFNSENIFKVDFFSDNFQLQNKNKYDIVISRGFIEHFYDPREVVNLHINILKNGGLLIVIIPNLTGIYWLWTYIFNKPQLRMHNLKLMKFTCFKDLFEIDFLKTNYVGLIGTFSFWLFTFKSPNVFMKILLRFFIYFQMILNCIFRFIFNKFGCESQMFSPNLIYIGTLEK